MTSKSGNRLRLASLFGLCALYVALKVSDSRNENEGLDDKHHPGYRQVSKAITIVQNTQAIDSLVNGKRYDHKVIGTLWEPRQTYMFSREFTYLVKQDAGLLNGDDTTDFHFTGKERMYALEDSGVQQVLELTQ